MNNSKYSNNAPKNKTNNSELGSSKNCKKSSDTILLEKSKLQSKLKPNNVISREMAMLLLSGD